MKQHLRSKQELVGWVYGFLGVLIFSLTLPATRIAVAELDPAFVGLGRAVVAAGLAIVLLTLTRQPVPPKRFLPRFIVVAVGVVIIGLLPLATALFGVWRGKERVSHSFWVFALMGSGLVICFALISGTKSFGATDLALFGAVAAAGMGYAEGVILARTFGAWQVICWSLVLCLPILLPIVIKI